MNSYLFIEFIARTKKMNRSRAFGATSLGLPIVVTWTILFVPIGPGRYTQACGTTFLAKEHTRFLEGGFRAPICALRCTLWIGKQRNLC